MPKLMASSRLKYEVRFTPSARRQFLSALAFIRADKPSAALAFRRKAEVVLRRLERFPQSGHPLKEFPELPHREVVVSPYRFFYRLVDKTAWIVSVWHGHQLPREPK
ncbi:MAG: type II toxin-antitoxin system RelE/ParE family toxin [Myxococcales bacterium]|nr:type II toxin-antitoxin system RelE/ParE family toxin [Myxococcales bacterium]